MSEAGGSEAGRRSSGTDPEVILAAGGLLWREGPNGPQLAMVHRARHDDWTLPKGKLRDGESPERAAIREVGEETGARARVLGYADRMHYEVDGSPKVVFYWHMTHVAGDFSPSEEVDQIVWLSQDDAMERVSYAGERDLLARAAASPPVVATEREPFCAEDDARGLSKLRAWWSRLRSRPSKAAAVRLLNEVREFEPEFEWILERAVERETDGPGARNRGWARSASAAMDKARTAACAHHVDAGWRSLLVARRLLVHGYDEAELRWAEAALREEAAQKLRTWRKVVVAQLLESPSWQQHIDDRRERLRLALAIRDEHFANTWFEDSFVRSQLTQLLAQLIVAITAILLLIGVGALDVNEDPGAPNVWFVVGVTLFGLLGACLSAIQAQARRGAIGNIPRHIAESRLTLFRPALGGAAALAIYALLVGGLLQVDVRAGDGLVVLAFAFAAGFSERLVLRAVETIGR